MPVPPSILISPKDYLRRAARRSPGEPDFSFVFSDFVTADLATHAAVIPTTLAEAHILQARRQEGGTVPALFPDAATIARCDDKLRCNEILIAAGFGAHIPPLGRPAEGQPFVLKARHGEFGNGSYLIPDAAATERMAGLIAAPDHFCQSYVAADREYACHFLLQDGQLRYHMEVEYQMQPAPYIRSAENRGMTRQFGTPSRFRDLFLGMLAALGFTEGTCCIDYKIAEGRPMLLEATPRFGGSLSNCLKPYALAYLTALNGAAMPA